MSRYLASLGAPEEDVKNVRNLFDGNVLTLGFARRFATYKRPTLLLFDPERLSAYSPSGPPGAARPRRKGPPADIPGQLMLRQWVDFIRVTPARNRVVFLMDYDMR